MLVLSAKVNSCAGDLVRLYAWMYGCIQCVCVCVCVCERECVCVCVCVCVCMMCTCSDVLVHLLACMRTCFSFSMNVREYVC